MAAGVAALGGLAMLAGTDAGYRMARDLLGVALWVLLGAAGLVALLRRFRERPTRRQDGRADDEWAERLRHSPTYELLPGNYWFSGLTVRHPTDDP